jgi:prepilin-type N-terminal cleavage/methylation domain-containing protein
MAESGNRRSSASGFTLLELLIVITIVALILAALTGGVRFAGQAWQVQERRSERRGDSDTVQSLVRELIASGAGFEGDSVSLRFVSELPEALARAGLNEVELHKVADRLVLSWRPHFRGPFSIATKTDTELAKGVADLNLSYCAEPPAWQTATADKTKPLRLVRVALRFSDGRAWPPLTVAPMVEVVPAVTN